MYPILDTRLLASRGAAVVETAGAILAAGARILQYRHKHTFDRATFDVAEQVAALCRRHGAIFVVNDRADFAMLLGAWVHLGQTDLPPADARRIMGDNASIGHSTHNQIQFRAAAAEPVDYLAFGPIFGTTSKENPDPTTGTDTLRSLRPLTAKPVVAIGGITRATARDVLDAGADSLAVIGDLYTDGVSPGAVSRTVEQWLRIVDGN